MVKQYVMLMLVLVWSGCIIAISFMESWLKFRAPGVTVPIGLSIGKLVFGALNKMEWFFVSVLLVTYFFNSGQIDTSAIISFGFAAGLLVMQTFWLLPALDARADIVISGNVSAPSSLHWYFVIGEVIKLSSLLILAFRLFKSFATH